MMMLNYCLKYVAKIYSYINQENTKVICSKGFTDENGELNKKVIIPTTLYFKFIIFLNLEQYY